MRLSNISDQELVSQYLNNNENAFEVLLRRHQQKVFSKIFFMVNKQELAEDLFQETFLKVINTLKGGRYNEEGKFLPWVLRIAHNLVIDHFRRDKKNQTISPNIGGADDDFDLFQIIQNDEENAEDLIIKNEVETELINLLEHLPEEQRQVVYMRHFQDLSFKEISENTEVSINTALGRMRYALINLRKIMAEKSIVLD
jgi:RNA polymerase sigma-70 factor (ECF subfamily)